jgi:hypothetical protein
MAFYKHKRLCGLILGAAGVATFLQWMPNLGGHPAIGA